MRRLFVRPHGLGATFGSCPSGRVVDSAFAIYQGLEVASSDIEVRGNRFAGTADRNTAGYGIVVRGGSPRIAGNAIAGWMEGVRVESGTPVISANEISGCWNRGIYDFSGSTIAGNRFQANAVGMSNQSPAGGRGSIVTHNVFLDNGWDLSVELSLIHI